MGEVDACYRYIKFGSKSYTVVTITSARFDHYSNFIIDI